MRHRFRWILTSLVLGPSLTAASCDLAGLTGNSVPASQEWLIVDQNAQIATLTTDYVTVLKGGAISQSSTYTWHDTPANTNTCQFPIPLSGNWNGTEVRITSTGGGCGIGYILTMTGSADGEYGKATTFSGTYTISYTGANRYPNASGRWTASLVH